MLSRRRISQVKVWGWYSGCALPFQGRETGSTPVPHFPTQKNWKANATYSMLKTCCMCKEDLPVDRFKANKARKDGLQSQCIECQKRYRRGHYENNKAKYIDKAGARRKDFKDWWREYKKQFSCSECPENHPGCIQFHHPNPDKEDDVSRLVNNGCKDRVLEEIAKCIPLCSNCHCKLHWEDHESRRINVSGLD